MRSGILPAPSPDPFSCSSFVRAGNMVSEKVVSMVTGLYVSATAFMQRTKTPWRCSSLERGEERRGEERRGEERRVARWEQGGL